MARRPVAAPTLARWIGAGGCGHSAPAANVLNASSQRVLASAFGNWLGPVVSRLRTNAACAEHPHPPRPTLPGQCASQRHVARDIARVRPRYASVPLVMGALEGRAD